MAGEVELGEARGIVLDVGHEDAARVVEADAHHRVEGARLHPKRVDDGLRESRETARPPIRCSQLGEKSILAQMMARAGEGVVAHWPQTGRRRQPVVQSRAGRAPRYSLERRRAARFERGDVSDSGTRRESEFGFSKRFEKDCQDAMDPTTGTGASAVPRAPALEVMDLTNGTDELCF